MTRQVGYLVLLSFWRSVSGESFTILNSWCGSPGVPCGSGLNQLVTYTSYTQEPPAVLSGQFHLYGVLHPVKWSDGQYFPVYTARLTMASGASFDFRGLDINKIEDQSCYGCGSEIYFEITASNGANRTWHPTCYDWYDTSYDEPSCSYWSFSGMTGYTTFTEFDDVRWVDFNSKNVKPGLRRFVFNYEQPPPSAPPPLSPPLLPFTLPSGPLAWWRNGDFTLSADGTSGSWPDSSGNGYTASLLDFSGGFTQVSEAGHGTAGVVTSLQGGTSSVVGFGDVIKAEFTICSLTRYTGANRKRILTGAENWLHGHHNGNVGVAHYNTWVTAYSTSVVDPVTDWLVFCGTNAGSYLKIANGQDVGTFNGGTRTTSMHINTGHNNFGETDFAVAEVAVWSRGLTANEIFAFDYHLRHNVLGVPTPPTAPPSPPPAPPPSPRIHAGAQTLTSCNPRSC